jgi:hypothetical protein
MSLWDSTAVSGGMHGMRSAVVIVATNYNAIELYIVENRVEKNDVVCCSTKIHRLCVPCVH